jgi:chromatin remodeling complex protein RSC6
MATKKSTAKKSSAKKSSGSKKGGAKSATKKAAPKKAAKKAPAKKATKKAAPKKAAKRTPNPSFMKPVQPDATLAAVVGEKAMPRTEITSKLWAYIKKNGLQDQQERRMINADDKLKPVFGGKSRVSMFDMTKLVNQHLKG